MPRTRPAILSTSLGRPWVHEFDNKARQAAKHGFEGIEIYYEDIEYLAKELYDPTGYPTTEQLCRAAERIRSTCLPLGLTILALLPFAFCEGLKDRKRHDDMIEKLQTWFLLVK